jgi:hypothetical protein
VWCVHYLVVFVRHKENRMCVDFCFMQMSILDKDFDSDNPGNSVQIKED